MKTVRDLIAELEKYDPESPVRLYDDSQEGGLIEVMTVPEDEDPEEGPETVYIQAVL